MMLAHFLAKNTTITTTGFFFLKIKNNIYALTQSFFFFFRIYVISRLRKLTQLDSSPVTPEEWRHASCLVSEEDELPLSSPNIPLSPFSPSQFQNF